MNATNYLNQMIKLITICSNCPNDNCLKLLKCGHTICDRCICRLTECPLCNVPLVADDLADDQFCKQLADKCVDIREKFNVKGQSSTKSNDCSLNQSSHDCIIEQLLNRVLEANFCPIINGLVRKCLRFADDNSISNDNNSNDPKTQFVDKSIQTDARIIHSKWTQTDPHIYHQKWTQTSSVDCTDASVQTETTNKSDSSIQTEITPKSDAANQTEPTIQLSKEAQVPDSEELVEVEPIKAANETIASVDGGTQQRFQPSSTSTAKKHKTPNDLSDVHQPSKRLRVDNTEALNIDKSPVILGSNLDQIQKRKLAKAAKELKFTLVTEWSPQVTHLVVGLAPKTKKSDLLTTRSVKYFMALVGNRWIVHCEWIAASLKNGSLVDPQPYEIQGVKNCDKLGCPNRSRVERIALFENCLVQIRLSTDSPISSNELKTIVRLGGGSISDDEDDPSKSIDQIDHPNQSMKRLIIYDESLNQSPFKTNNSIQIPVSKLLDSITRLNTF